MDALVELTLGMIPAILAAALAARWSVAEFHSEKNWETQERAYEEIISALYDFIQYCRIQKEDYGQGTGLSAEAEQDLFRKYVAASSALSRATDVGSFYISDHASDILNDLRKRERLDYRTEPHFEFFECEYRVHKAALEEILMVAKSDLNIG